MNARFFAADAERGDVFSRLRSGLNDFIGEFHLQLVPFAIAASFTAVAVIGLLHCRCFYARGCGQPAPRVATKPTGVAFAELRPNEKWVIIPVTFLERVRHRHRPPSTFSTPLSCRLRGAIRPWSKDVGFDPPIAEKIFICARSYTLDRDLARLYGVQTRVLNQRGKA